MEKHTKIKITLFFLTILVAIFIIQYFNLGHYAKNPDLMREEISSFGIMAPIVYIIIYSFLSMLFFPGSILSISGGILFGTFKGTLYALVGAIIGGTLAFLVARYFGQKLVDRILEKRFKNLDKQSHKLKEKGFISVLILRLLPFIPFNIVNFSLGITKIKFRDYFLATLVGILPGTLLYTYFGDAIAEFNFRNIIISILLMILLFILIYIYRYRKRGKK